MELLPIVRVTSLTAVGSPLQSPGSLSNRLRNSAPNCGGLTVQLSATSPLRIAADTSAHGGRSCVRVFVCGVSYRGTVEMTLV
jgi:hypothetical protein